ncbi:MAG: hypothetical protein ABS35_36420 [Kaistia sp. SCN 65-12]|nr:MAG: hypothetical protein ABS35_36420 [Kaistia sp. SCN 65-12]
MTRHFLSAFASLCIVLAVPAMAKEVDVSKLTCKQVGAMSPAKIVGVAMWMSGFMHGKAGNTMVDGEKAHANAEKIAAYCKSNGSATLASAVDAVFK